MAEWEVVGKRAGLLREFSFPVSRESQPKHTLCIDGFESIAYKGKLETEGKRATERLVRNGGVMGVGATDAFCPAMGLFVLRSISYAACAWIYVASYWLS